MKCLLGVEEHSSVDRHMGRFIELHPGDSLNHFYETFLTDFLWPIISIFLVLGVYLVYLRSLPCLCTSLSQDGFHPRGPWIVGITPLLTS